MNRNQRAALLAFTVCCLAACRSGDERQTTAALVTPHSVTTDGATESSTDEPYEAPLTGAAEAALGASLTDIYQAVLSARRPFVADCVSQSGWSISAAELEELFDSGDRSDGTVTGRIDQIIADLETPPTVIPEQQDRRRLDQIVICVEQAEVRFGNPNNAVIAATEDFERDVAARVATDARLAAAEMVRDECSAAGGVAVTNGVEPMDQILAQIAEARIAVEDETKSVAEAVSELRNIQATAMRIEDCYELYNEALEIVVSEVQKAELDRRPELIPSIVEQTRVLMDQYRDLLPDSAGQ